MLRRVLLATLRVAGVSFIILGIAIAALAFSSDRSSAGLVGAALGMSILVGGLFCCGFAENLAILHEIRKRLEAADGADGRA